MKRVFKFKKGEETEDLADTDLLNFLQDYLLNYEHTTYGMPTFKNNFKVTIVVERIK